MAKTISLEFTDGQWELIQAHYVTTDEKGRSIDCTEETFIENMKIYIGRKVTTVMANKAAVANQNAFNV